MLEWGAAPTYDGAHGRPQEPPWLKRKGEMKFKWPVLILLAGSMVITLNSAPAHAAPGARKPLTKAQIMELLLDEVSSRRVAMLVEQRGIDFEPTEDDFRTLHRAGAQEVLLMALRTARRVPPKEVVVRQHCDRARQLEEKGGYTEAEREYRAALELDPGNAAVYSALGNVLVQQGKWGSAVAAFRQAVRRNPDDAEAHFNLGAAFRAAGNLDGAMAEFREAARLKPDEAKAHERVGRLCAEKRDWKQAVVAYQAVVRLQADSSQAHNNLGFALRNQGDLKGAIAAFQEAVRLQPGDAIAHNNLGFTLEEKGELQAALEQYRIASRLSPQDPAIRANFEAVTRKLKRPSLVEQ